MDIVSVCADLRLFGHFCDEWEHVVEWVFALMFAPVTDDGVPARINGVVVAWDKTTAWYVPIGGGRRVTAKAVLQLLRRMFGAAGATKVAVNAKAAWQTVAVQLGVPMAPPVCDPAVMYWLNNPDKLKEPPASAEALYNECFGVFGTGVAAAGGIGVNGANGAIRTVEGASREAFFALEVFRCQVDSAEVKPLLGHLKAIEMELMPILAQMELQGVAVDLGFVNGQIELLRGQQEAISAAARQLVKATGWRKWNKFSMTNTKDIKHIITKVFKMRSSAGKPVEGTSKDVLNDLIEIEDKKGGGGGGNAFPRLIKHFRSLERALTKDCSQLIRVQNGATDGDGDGGKRVHFHCNVFTATGRIAIHDPNLQNIPKPFTIPCSLWAAARPTSGGGNGGIGGSGGGGSGGGGGDLEVSLRNALIPSSGWTFAAFDYHQIELRVIAHLSQDQQLVVDMSGATDIFVTMAATLFQCAAHAVSRDQRQIAKGFSYGTMYGMGADTMIKNCGVDGMTTGEAKVLISRFKQRYHVATTWITTVKATAQKNTFITMISGRKRMYRDLKSQKPTAVHHALRQAVNNLAQGSAADLVKAAMIRVTKALAGRTDVRLLLMIHDELLFEVRPEVLPTVGATIKRVMEACPMDEYAIRLPFPVRMEAGPSWGKLQAVELPAAIGSGGGASGSGGIGVEERGGGVAP
jgi:DNA polymerase I-like protein with 3'-5' exonuclease and polymerase domains